jgi:hypothetical protein
MKKKTTKKFEKLSPIEKAAAVVAGAVYVPFAVIYELSKKPKYQSSSKKRKSKLF